MAGMIFAKSRTFPTGDTSHDHLLCYRSCKCDNSYKNTLTAVVRWRSNNDLRLQKLTNSSWLRITTAIICVNGRILQCISLAFVVTSSRPFAQSSQIPWNPRTQFKKHWTEHRLSKTLPHIRKLLTRTVELDPGAGAGVKNFWMVKPDPDISVPVPQTHFCWTSQLCKQSRLRCLKNGVLQGYVLAPFSATSASLTCWALSPESMHMLTT